MTREEAQAISRAGEEAVVRVLLDFSSKGDQLTADFANLKAENLALHAECQPLRERVHTLEGQTAKDSHNSHKPPCAGKAGSHVGENPTGRIRRFTTERDARNEAARLKPQAGHLLNQQAIMKMNSI